MYPVFRLAAFVVALSIAAGPALAIDPFFSEFGNDGIDVGHYTLELNVNPYNDHLEAWAALDVRAERPLKEFTLDLRGLDVSAVTVNGYKTAFSQAGGKLTITPRRRIEAHAPFRVYVAYAGYPEPIRNPTAPDDPTLSLGWIAYREAIYVTGEPVGASSFFPVNEEPDDKATFTIAVTVPAPYAGIANGVLTSARDIGNERRFVWDMRQPMMPSRATVHINRFNARFARTPSGKPVSVFSTPATPRDNIEGYLLATRMIPYFESLVGPYPFEAYGSVVVDDPFLAYALPTQAMTTFPLGAADEAFVAHELAHQWFGDSVSIARWTDQWLSEGLATYMEVLWRHRDDPLGFDATMRGIYRYVAARRLAAAVIDSPKDLYSERVSLRGAAALYALRLKVGDPTFLMILRRFAFEFAGRSATSADFIRTAVSVSDNFYVAELLHAWLYEKAVPSIAGIVSSRGKLGRPDVVALRCPTGSAGNAHCG